MIANLPCICTVIPGKVNVPWKVSGENLPFGVVTVHPFVLGRISGKRPLDGSWGYCLKRWGAHAQPGRAPPSVRMTKGGKRQYRQHLHIPRELGHDTHEGLTSPRVFPRVLQGIRNRLARKRMVEVGTPSGLQCDRSRFLHTRYNRSFSCAWPPSGSVSRLDFRAVGLAVMVVTYDSCWGFSRVELCLGNLAPSSCVVYTGVPL